MKLHGATLDDVLIFSLSIDGAGHPLRPGFKLGEFASRDGCDTVMVHPLLLDGLVELKAHFAGAIVRINSAYRTIRHNTAVGGRQMGLNRQGGSRHIFGYAADVDVLHVRPKLVADWAEYRKWGGVGRYDTFTHLDVWGEDRRWRG